MIFDYFYFCKNSSHHGLSVLPKLLREVSVTEEASVIVGRQTEKPILDTLTIHPYTSVVLEPLLIPKSVLVKVL